MLCAQQNNPANSGTVKGIVRDTAQNYVLKSATVSVYKAADSTLISYQVTNNYGEFIFKNLPINLPLRLDINHVGYTTARKQFSISKAQDVVDLKTIVINRRDILLDDVVISVPPVSVNGDTLEFNAAAFKLDSNATVEDMLRAIPNITLWGDGQITVNGSEVKSLKVNGKSFFGDDAKIALQNISKNALQKVQVYNTARDKSNPLDSTLEMNLKLKKGKDIGYFGKLGAGYGTRERFETDASINMFSPKMQLALVAAMNNVNKTPNNLNDMMRNSTFRGVSSNVEYQPDFRQTGINRPSAAGASMTYNFFENPTYQEKSELKANYLLKGKKSDYRSETQTTTTVGDTEKVFERAKTINSSSNTIHGFDSHYKLAKKGNYLELSQSVNINDGESTDQTFRNAGNLQDELTSTNNTMNTSNFNNRSFKLRADYQYSPNVITSRMRFRSFNASYDLSFYDNERQNLNMTEFVSFTDPTANRKFNRRYQTTDQGLKQQIDMSLPDLRSIIFGNSRLAGFNATLTNNLVIKSDKNNNRVEDLDTLSNNYRLNTYLSNQLQTNTIEETPGLSIEKPFYKSLSNRYHKSFTLSFHPKALFIIQDNKSDRSFQNLKRNYQNFAPDGSIRYSDYQYGEYSKSFDLSYRTTLRIPTIQQLAPLTDSTNLYNLQRGNLNLREALQKELSFSLSHYDQGEKNALNYSLRISAGLIDDNIVDSINIDDQNRRTVYLVNANGHKYLNLSGDINKAYKLKSGELQLNLSTQLNTNRNPGFTNNQFTYSSNLNTNTNASIHFTSKGKLAAQAIQSFETYQSKQEAFNTKYSGKNLATSLNTSYLLTKKFKLNSNITFNNSSSSGAENINFTIWNASAEYRFLKGNNAEIKFSALDLLRQNSSVINYGDFNSFTLGTQNVLRQYFMITISYYPRQFGKKAKGNK